MLVGVAHIVAFGMIAYDAAHGQLSAAHIVLYGQAILASFTIGLIGDPQWTVARAAGAAQRLVDIRGRIELPPDGRAVAPPRTGAAAIELRGVRFTYPSRDLPTLDGLDLTIPAGQSIAIVGENGAGKSTLIKLLAGLYLADQGTVRIDGVDLASAHLEVIRRRIAAIFQQFVRYHLPLRENVGYGDLTHLHDDHILADALRSAGGAAVLERLEHGWDTVLSAEYEDGTDLSGGQWQRVALARALAAINGGAGVLILDEPTAALDIRAEVELFERFLEVTHGMTTILVSHRLSSVRHADRIVVVEGGRLVEDGSHGELMATGGRYAKMFNLQAQRFREADPEK